MAKTFTAGTMVDIAEALAVFEGMPFATRMCIRDFIVESDSLRVRREGNEVDHILAHVHVNFSSDNSSSHVWLEDYPSSICIALKSDILY
ncbi:uncharacterized protein G2W53_007876 [Senna tora]|uniref:RNase H type-1 domain-containing protein n=1 Tax=Senna tora TaxID=362788 RepID=A0A834X794_9FABA|nr:uncharacterized protein G2W53_007876 [Senna tora]